MLYFNVIMLLLAVTAQFRGPVSTRSSALWFFIGWLPGELPWLFATIQTLGTLLFVLTSESMDFRETSSFVILVATLVFWYHLHFKTILAGPVLQAALRDALGKNFESTLTLGIGVSSPPVIQQRDWLNPFRYTRKGVECLQNISYGDAKRNKLDIYRGTGASQNSLSRPVLLHIHGGAWVIGNKNQQAKPLINYLAQNGWICVDINYRLAPHDRYPDCLIDVKKAIVWIKENIHHYGGDPNFIAITGESAGGHLCALAALTANNPEFQPGFEERDTRVQSVVPVYGVYDFTNQRDSLMRSFLEKYVMPKKSLANPDSFRSASPIFRINNLHLPMFVIHGDKDCVVPVQQARNFVQALKQKNSAPVIYAELSGAQHGFDIFHSVRTEFHIESVGKFLHYCYVKHPAASIAGNK
jgi:acetyl esterase/lipase